MELVFVRSIKDVSGASLVGLWWDGGLFGDQGSFSSSYTIALDFLRNCSTTCLQEIRKLSRCGGADLSDIRNYPAPAYLYQYSMDPTNSSSKRSTPKTGSTTLSKFEKFAEIQRRKEYEEFIKLNDNAAREQLVVKDILPADGGHLFNNLAPLTDGTLANSKPDSHHGSTSSQLKPGVRKQLSSQINPSTQSSGPVAPNFFALGLYLNQPNSYDNNTYTITSTFQAGTLGLYTTHPMRSIETYQQGLNAYQNAGYLAEELKGDIIWQANERYAAGQDHASISAGSKEAS
ncbi:hypothetical protein BDV06DRAFT_217516 [Aspergillus oleicola]